MFRPLVGRSVLARSEHSRGGAWSEACSRRPYDWCSNCLRGGRLHLGRLDRLGPPLPDPSLDDAELEWAALWNPLPKVVFSTTLSEVQGNARLASGGLADEIERLRDEPGEGEIAIGGATLAAEAAALGLIDEYQLMVHPVLVGGGIPFFAQRERRVDIELVETRTFSSRVVYLRYRVAR